MCFVVSTVIVWMYAMFNTVMKYLKLALSLSWNVEHMYWQGMCNDNFSWLETKLGQFILKLKCCILCFQSKCNEVADKYIEYDTVIIFLDVLLLQRPAYRHILINSNFKVSAYTKLQYCTTILILLICVFICQIVFCLLHVCCALQCPMCVCVDIYIIWWVIPCRQGFWGRLMVRLFLLACTKCL